MNTSLLNDKSYIEKLNVIIKESEVRLAHEDTSNPAAAWEYLKYEIQRFSITYSKEKAQMCRNKVSMLTSKLSSLEKRLACINLKSDSAVRTIQLINEKIDIVKAELNAKLRYTEAEHITKYFFALEKNISCNKQMGSTRTQDRKITYNRKQILNEQHRFYPQLYSSNQSVEFANKYTQGPMISQDQKFELGKEITLEEISTAIKEMPRNKTPGADGIPTDFYKMFFVKLKWILLEQLNIVSKWVS